MLGTLGCVRDVGGVGEGFEFVCLPFCHALFLGGFHCFSGSCAPWLRGVGMVVDGAGVWIGIVGEGIWRVVVGLCLVVLCCLLDHGAFGTEIWGIWGGFWGQLAIFGVLGGVCHCVGCGRRRVVLEG